VNLEVAFYIAAAACVVAAAGLLLMFVLYQRERRRSLYVTDRWNTDHGRLASISQVLVETQRALESTGTNRRQAVGEAERHLTNLRHEEERHQRQSKPNQARIAEGLRAIVLFCTSVKSPTPEELSRPE
jgi:hypothetical protein